MAADKPEKADFWLIIFAYMKVKCYSAMQKLIDEKGYKMRKEYIKPEAEMMKFLEEEEIMTKPGGEIGTMNYYFSTLNLTAL